MSCCPMKHEAFVQQAELCAENERLRQALNAVDCYLRDNGVSFYSEIRQQIDRMLRGLIA